MTTKVNIKCKELILVFHEKTSWNLSRVKFLVAFICSMCKLQTVCFTKLAQGLEGNAKVESNLRRIQRFFAEFIVDSDLIAKIIFPLLPSEPPYRLSLDRTNWKFGKTDINILMISICYHGVAIPLIWTMLPKRGNSNSQERKALLERYIRLFGKRTIESILADREFIGDGWISDLIGNNIHFHIRIKENMWVDIPGKGKHKVFWFFNKLPFYKARYIRKIVKIGDQWVYLSGMRVMGNRNNVEFVIIASYSFSEDVLEKYKDRWQIETMFKALKTSGFNLEDTHLMEMERISKLLSLICLAFLWAYLVGIYRNKKIKPIKIKKHGRRQYSYFKYGLIFIAHALLNSADPEIAVIVKILSCT